jgi:Prolyl-tRNA synthetase
MLTLTKDKESESYKLSEQVYKELISAKVDVLWDDRLDCSAGEKFVDADLIGVPMRVIISEKSIQAGGGEIKDRKSGESQILDVRDFLKSYMENC